MMHLPPAQRTAPTNIDPEAVATFKRVIGNLLQGGRTMEWRAPSGESDHQT
jgi:hypothetical protein